MSFPSDSGMNADIYMYIAGACAGFICTLVGAWLEWKKHRRYCDCKRCSAWRGRRRAEGERDGKKLER